MKIGIIGYGKIGKIRHEMCEKILDDSEYRIYDPQIENCPDPEEIIDWADSVFICTPNYLTKDYTVKALKKNKHVFCEKPPALNYDEMIDVQTEYEKTDSVLIYGFNHRQYDSIQKMKEIIDDSDSGKILWMRGRYGKAMGDPNTGGWRSDPNKSGGGILLDQGIHMLDLMNWFGGNFDEVQSVVTNNMWGLEGIEDNAFINLYNSKENISASLHSTMIEWRHIFSLEVVLEKKYIALNGLKTPSGSYGKEVLTICEDKHFDSDESKSVIIEFKNNNTWEKEVSNFLDLIDLGVKSSNIEDAVEVMRLIKESYNWRNK
jgi:predicted dehydrogenase